jgi:hypothetical protein
MVEYRLLSYRVAAVYFPFSALTYTFLPYCASCLVRKSRSDCGGGSLLLLLLFGFIQLHEKLKWFEMVTAITFFHTVFMLRISTEILYTLAGCFLLTLRLYS